MSCYITCVLYYLNDLWQVPQIRNHQLNYWALHFRKRSLKNNSQTR